MELCDALGATRFHHQLHPKDQIDCETRSGVDESESESEPASRLPRRTIKGLEELGYTINIRSPIGDEQAILVNHNYDPPRVDAGSDPRGEGQARRVEE
jgi:gamma-glutamyltranspeptidase